MNIFIKNDVVISSFIVPWILGIGCRNKFQAKKYIKCGERLSPSYYPGGKREINEKGEDHTYSRFMDNLFNEKRIDDELTLVVGEPVYKPWDCISGIYKIDITEQMGLVARPDGITKNNEIVVMVDCYLDKYFTNTDQELKIKLLSTMAVWKAKKGIYFIKKMNTTICIDFDNTKWEEILQKLKLWSQEDYVQDEIKNRLQTS